MRPTAWALVAVTGCNAVFGLDGVRLVDGAAGPIDAGADASCPADVDCDGALDPTDNCPAVANPDQHDEDVDTLGDACDNCPQAENLAQFDTSEVANGLVADGVGDACDPHMLARDRLVWFEPFAGPADAAWVLDGAQLAIAGGALAITGDSVPPQTALHPLPAGSSGHVHVVAQLELDAIPAMNGDATARGLSMYLASDAMAATGRRCEWVAKADELGTPKLVGQDPLGAAVTPVVTTEPMSPGKVTMLAHQVPGAKGEEALWCSARAAGWSSGYEAFASSAGVFTTGAIGLVFFRVIGRVTWVAVYDHVP